MAKQNIISGVADALNRLTGRTFTMIVGRDWKLDELVETGGYDYVDPEITDHAAKEAAVGTGQYSAEYRVLRFKDPIPFDRIGQTVRALGYDRPANLRELAAYGIRQRGRKIVGIIAAASSNVMRPHNVRRTAVIAEMDGGGRALTVGSLLASYGDCFKLLVVRDIRPA